MQQQSMCQLQAQGRSISQGMAKGKKFFADFG